MIQALYELGQRRFSSCQDHFFFSSCAQNTISHSALVSSACLLFNMDANWQQFYWQHYLQQQAQAAQANPQYSPTNTYGPMTHAIRTQQAHQHHPYQPSPTPPTPQPPLRHTSFPHHLHHLRHLPPRQLRSPTRQARPRNHQVPSEPGQHWCSTRLLTWHPRPAVTQPYKHAPRFPPAPSPFHPRPSIPIH